MRKASLSTETMDGETFLLFIVRIFPGTHWECIEILP